MGIFSTLKTLGRPKETQQQLLNQLQQYNWEEWEKQNQQPTVNNTLAKIFQISSQNQEQGDLLAYQFMQLQNDRSSMFYNPFTKPTNPAVQVFADEGIDVSNINDEWFEQYSWLKNYYETSGTTNNVKAPTKNSTREQKLAYSYNQLLQQREKTNLAEQESKALREELTYWAQQTDTNYSDDEIMSRVDWSKYPTLAEMRIQGTQNKGTPIELNRAVPGWSDDWMKGVLWAARNDGGSGSDNMNQAYSAMGIGNQWQENEEISRRLNPNDEMYSPYKVGSTMANERQLFGVSGFGDEWLANSKPGAGASDAENKGYKRVREAEAFTKTAEEEAAKFKEWFDRQATRWKKPEDALKDLDRMVERYPSLKKLNDSLNDAGTDGLIDTTRAIDFSLYDYKQMAMEICEKNQNAPTVTSVLKTHDMAVITDQQAAVAEAQEQKVRDIAGAMDESGTPAERNVFSLTPSTMYNLAIEKLKTIETGINKIISTAMPLVSAKATSDMIPMYTDVNSNREAKEALTGINDRLAALNNAYFDKYDDTQKGSLYAISQSEEFMKLLAEDPTNADMLNYIYYEVYPGTEYNEEEAKAAVQTLLEGIPDPNELVKLESQKAEYESIIDRTSGAEQQLNDRLDQMNHLIDVYEKSGIDTTEMRTSLAVSKSMQYFSAYEATKWEPYNTYELMMLGLDSGEGYEAIRADAEQLNTENVTRLEAYQAMKDYLIDNNISVADDYMNNLDRLIAKLERDKTDYEYFSLMGDADFDKTAARGMKHFDENYDRDRLEAEYHREGYYTIEDSRYYDLLTDDEKKTYYYLYEKGGLEEANKYLNYLSDGTYGVLTTRFTENQKQYAQNEVRGGFFSAAWANMKALISAPLEGINGVAYLLDSAISGKELNPNSPLLTLSAFSNATMAESTQAIKDGLKDSGIGEDSVLGQIALGAYEIFYNRGRSMVNGVVTGGITSGITNAIVQELVGASVMALGAGATAAAEAKAKGAQDWQAYLIGAVTTVMEDFTEGITYSNIQDVLHGVKDAAENGVVTGLKDKVVSWLTKEGPQEMFGETLTDVVEGLTDTMVMRGLSDHADRVAAFVDKGMTQEEAEQAAFRDEISGILHTALISYLSPGADIPTATIGETINSYNYVRETTREMQQQGMDTNMLETMRQYRAFRQQQKEEAKDRKANPMKYAPDRVYEEASTQEANAVAPVEQTAVEQTAQEPAAPEAPQLSEADMALLKNLGVLDASYDADTSSQTASMAATFGGVDGTVEGDMSKAAACAAAELFGVDFNQEYKALLVTDHELGADGEDVKHAVMTASLSQSSEARAVMTSPEYKTMPAAKKVALLKGTIARDNGNQTVMDEITQNTHEYRVAETEKTLIANGQIPSVEAFKQKQATADKAAQALNQARDELDARQKEQDQKGDNLGAAVEALNADATSPDNMNEVTHALNEFEKAQAVTKEYEQHLANTEEANAKAQQDADEAKQQALTDLRQEAERIVADQNAQREERAAQEQALRDQREQEAAKAQAEADEISGKADEDRRDAMIEDLLNRDHLEGEEREQKKQEYLERAEQIKLGKIDMTGLMNNTEGILAVSAFGRKLGLSFELSDTLPGNARGKYQNGVVYLNNNLIKQGKMTVGQALVEASLHEITHSMEDTKNYKTYKKVVLDSLFGNDMASYQAAIDQKIADYKNTVNQALTPEQAEKEIIADFARTKLNAKDVVQRFMDNGLGGKMRNTLHNINQAIKNFRLTGEEKTTAEYLRKAERAFQKAINEVAKTSSHPEGGQFSVAQFAQAAGLNFNQETLELYDQNGNKIDGVSKDRKVTAEMIDGTPAGMLIDLARDGSMTKSGRVKFSPTISAETAQAQKQMFADMMNMVAQYKDSNLVWEIASSTMFSAMKSNSDPQYSTTIDFGTVCSKTQEIINVLSRTMLEKGRGLTRDEVLKVYNETANAGLTVPCPVCYVFSRWMGVPSLLNQMSQYQKRFVKTNEDGSIDMVATKEEANKYIKEALDKYGSKDKIDDAKVSITNRMKTQENNRSDALKVLNSETATEEEKAKAKQKHDDAIAKLDELSNDLGEVEAYNWVTQALCLQEQKGKKKVNVLDKNGDYVIDPSFQVTPDEILFDLRQTGEFAKYTKNWSYRNTRGAGMGKAIMPYSGETIGDVIFGTTRKAEIQNPFLTLLPSKAADGIKNAIKRAQQQNLIGGQRLQSTSDFRPEWGLDYMMAFLELQAVGSKVQMYTKVAEAVDFLASVGADVNLSIMGQGQGWHVGENGDKVLDFSDVTGMKYETAKALKDKYDNVQMILVGMNDTHIRLAIANPDIDFVIPWHSSGNSKDALSSMISSVGEKLETSSDYTDSQTDKPREDQTEEQKNLWNLRMKILKGEKINAEERNTIYHDEILKGLYDRFNTQGVDPDCYHVKLGNDQAKQIFPYEYWDKSLTKDQADQNGKNFVAYCEHFGITPRFSQFQEDTGYWKLLIDRPMYDNNGNYRDQQVVDVTKAKIGSLDENGKLQDSDLPLKTSAMYGPNYSEQEKMAVDNSLAAIESAERANMNGGQYSVFGDMTTADMEQIFSDYQDAVDRGDLDAAQQDVDFYAEQNGYTEKVYHGTNSYGFTTFDMNKGKGVIFTSYSKDLAGTYATNEQSGTYELYAKPGNQLVVDAENRDWDDIPIRELAKDAEAKGYNDVPDWWFDTPIGSTSTREIADYAKKHGYDSVRINNVVDNGSEGDVSGLTDIGIFFNQSDIKSAAPVTYDDNGNVIPLSERFNTENPDIRYSAGGERTTADIDQELLDAGIVTREDLDKMQQKSVGEGQRQFGQGMLQESNEIDDLAKQYVLAHNGYTQDSNEDQINRAIKWIHDNRNHADSDGYQESLAKVTSGRFNYRTADGQARMVAVMGMAVAKGDISAQVQLADAFNKQGTDLGQALQARKLFRMMTPEGRIASIQKMLDNTQDELNAKGTNVTLKFSDWIYQAAATATEEGDMQKVYQAAAQELAAQLPANWRDKFRGWRMLSMLGNPRTHIRNIVGNALFIPAVGLKNKIAAVMELGVEQGNKTKTLAPFLSKEVRDFARKDARFMKDTLTGEAKYNEDNAVQKEQKPFKGLLQAIIDFNSNMLEKEDWIFLKGHYRRALGGWMQANGYTAEQLQNDAKLLETGRAYAVEEAQKATYRDFSKLASTLNKVSREGGVAGFVVDAALPFKKTPANILKRGMEYSPAGLMRSLTTDIYHLKQWQDAQNGKLNDVPEKALSPTQFIDRLCSGLAGTAIMAVGALLGSAGIVSCGLDDDEDELEKAKGNQEYSFKFSILGHDYTYTVDWAAPMSMPFFVGAAIQEQLANQQGFDIESLVDAVGNISEPVYNLSMLDGINSLFKTSQYDDTNTITQIGAKIASNYVTSYVPSLLGAVARTIDDTRRKSFVESGKGTGVVGTFRYAMEQVENKIPGMSQTNIPYRDVFGRPETSSLAERIIENFISPGYISEYRNDPVLNEIGRLYDVNAADVGSLVPDDPAKSVTYNKEKYVLSAEQWDQYKAVRGETAYKLLNQLIQSPDYQDADTATQAQMIKDTWSYADKVGRSTFIPDYELPNMGANPVANITRTATITGYKNEMIKALNAEDYTAYETMVQALRDADVEDSEIKTKIGDTFRDLYKEAYRRNDEQGRQRMMEIEDMLLMTGFNFDVYAWQEQVDKKYGDNTSGSLNPNNMLGGMMTTLDAGGGRGNRELMWQSMYNNTAGNEYGLGNIDLNNRQVVWNPDGTFSTEQSFSVNIDGKEVLLPTVIDGRIVSEDEAIEHYYRTGEYLGRFNTVEEAEEYARRLHQRQEWYYSR